MYQKYLVFIYSVVLLIDWNDKAIAINSLCLLNILNNYIQILCF